MRPTGRQLLILLALLGTLAALGPAWGRSPAASVAAVTGLAMQALTPAASADTPTSAPVPAAGVLPRCLTKVPCRPAIGSRHASRAPPWAECVV